MEPLQLPTEPQRSSRRNAALAPAGHYPSDAIAGAVSGVALAPIAVAILRSLTRKSMINGAATSAVGITN